MAPTVPVCQGLDDSLITAYVGYVQIADVRFAGDAPARQGPSLPSQQLGQSVSADVRVGAVLRQPLQGVLVGQELRSTPTAIEPGDEVRVVLGKDQLSVDRVELDAGSTLLGALWLAPQLDRSVPSAPTVLAGEIALRPSGEVAFLSPCAVGMGDTFAAAAATRTVGTVPGLPQASAVQSLVLEAAADPAVATEILVPPVPPPSVVYDDVPNPGPLGTQSSASTVPGGMPNNRGR